MPEQLFTKGVEQELDLNVFTRDGYTFSGWKTKADGSGDAYEDGMRIKADKDGILYAQWKAETPVRPLKIVKHPMDHTAIEGERAEFFVEAAGDGLMYQWFIDRGDGKGWRRLEGADDETYVTSPAELRNDGFRYCCVVFDQFGNAIHSDAAELHVLALPVMPETGDSSVMMLWLMMSMMSVLGAALLRKRA